MEHGIVVLVQKLFDEFERYFQFVFLAPLDELGFEVDFFARHLVQIDVALEYFLLHELLAAVVTLVDVYGTDEGFESIAVHVAVVRRRARGRLYQFVQSDVYGQLVQCFALYDFGAGIGQETFAFPFEMTVDDVAYDGVEDGVAEKFQPFVVQGTAFFGTQGGGFVQQCLLVNLYVARVEAQYLIKTKIRLPVFVKQEPYLVYLIA